MSNVYSYVVGTVFNSCLQQSGSVPLSNSTERISIVSDTKCIAIPFLTSHEIVHVSKEQTYRIVSHTARARLMLYLSDITSSCEVDQS